MNSFLWSFTIWALIAGPYVSAADDSDEFGIAKGRRSTSCSCGWRNPNTKRIINGEEAGMHEFPLIAAVVRPATMLGFCGGSILTQYHVLSAAHCFQKDDGREIAVAVGEHDLDRKNETPYTQVITVEKVINHAGYGNINQKNDIALLVLKSPIKFNQQVGPACLPYEPIDLLGKKVWAAGWGRIEAEGKSSSVLLKVELDVVPLKHCKKAFNLIQLKNPTQICTYTKGKDTCKGDSGGPLLYRNPQTNRFTLVGVVSFGKSCGEADGGIWTDVYSYRDWIHENIEATKPGLKTCS